MSASLTGSAPHKSIGGLANPEADRALLHRLKEAIVQENPTAIMCIKTATKDCSEEQWNRVFNQLDSQHQAYVQQKTEQHNSELRDLQDTVRRNMAAERRLLDEQLANHRSAIGSAEHRTTYVHSPRVSGPRRSRDYGDLLSPASVEERRHLCDHLAESGNSVTDHHAVGAAAAVTGDAALDELNRLRAALAARERELALAEDRLARSRHLCDTLLGRLTAAEAELQFLRNRRTDRRVSVSVLGCDEGGGSEQAAPPSGDAAAADSLRRSLADLERRQLIDTAADALELPGDPAELERRYDCLQVERREVEAALTRVPRPGSVHHSWHSARDQELLEQKLDNIDKELVHLRNSLKHFQLI